MWKNNIDANRSKSISLITVYMEPGEAVGKPRSKKMSVTADYQLLKLTNQLAHQDLKKEVKTNHIVTRQKQTASILA